MVDRTIYIGNLSSSVSEAALITFFSCCGPVSACRLAGDPGYPARFAFIEFFDPQSAMNALSLNGTQLADRPLRVTPSKTPIAPPNPVMQMSQQQQYMQHAYQHPQTTDLIPRTIYVSGLDVQLNEQHVQEFFSICGVVTGCRLCGDTNHPSRFAFVEFGTKEAAMAAMGLNGIALGNFPIRIQPSRTAIQPTPVSQAPHIMSYAQETAEKISRTIYIGGVEANMTERDVINFFSNCGTIAKLCLAGDKVHAARFAFVEFETFEGAQNALSLNGAMIGNRPIRVNPSKTPIYAPPTVLPAPTRSNPTEETSIIRKVVEAQSQINRRLDDGTSKKEKRGRSRSSSRSPSRGRSRSRSRDRKNKGTIKKHKNQRSRSRSREKGSETRNGENERKET